jgi:hypothetical protein
MVHVIYVCSMFIILCYKIGKMLFKCFQNFQNLMSNFIKILLSTQMNVKSKIKTYFAKYSYKHDHF